jgi:4-amino-4-deoxy-L-arabinose transferase-like glycosyltransferase
LRRIRLQASEAAVPVFVLAALALLYLVTVLPNIGNDPIVGGDEGWIMSASAKLAETGVFGSDLFAGFYGADEHYFFNLPLHHLILAGVFEVAGVSVSVARLVSAAFGLITLVFTYVLGRRFGTGVALGAAALLVLLRLNLTPLSGLTLTDLGATVRYDLVAVPYGLAAALTVVAIARAGRPYLSAGAAGLLLGLAALTQFIGALFIAPVVLFLLSERAMTRSRRLALTTMLFVAMALPFVPYTAYILDNWDDFRGQARAVEQQTHFLSPSFYWEQLRDEPERYGIGTGLSSLPDSLGDLVSRPSAKLAVLLVAPLAIIHSGYRAWHGSTPHRLLALMLVGLVVQLALFESTKRFVYAVGVVPFACVAIADLAVAGWRWRPPNSRYRVLSRAAIAGVAALFLVEGLAVAAQDVRDAGDAPDYTELTRRLEAALPAGASAVGDNRLWPALQDRDYRSLLLLFYHTNPSISRDRATDVFGAMERIDVDDLLLSPLSREILSQLSPRDAADFARFLQERAELVDTVAFPDYGPIEVYRLRE